ncbi:MAG: NADAR family protein [Oscillospiraceae bacterium]|nr:NADAR family protein [Oscillospiraceae bacterium]
MSDFVFFFREDEEYGCFSNFYPCEFEYAGQHYTSSEQFMMAQKALAFWDIEMVNCIHETNDPKEAKALGKKVKNYDDAVWSAIRPQIVRRGVRAKFQQNEDLRKILLETGDRILVEASPYDDLWGIKMAAGNAQIEDPSNWKGQNLLGKVLMKVRADLRTWLQSGDIRYSEVNELELDYHAGSIWNMQIKAVLQNPIAYEIVYPYILCAEYITKKHMPSFDFIRRCGDATLDGLNFDMATNMGGGLPCCGFYEMYQDMFDAVRFGCI